MSRPAPAMGLDLYPRRDLVERLVEALSGDPRVEAVWLEGSLARGDADRFSDIDLHVLLGAADGGSARDVLTDLPAVLANAADLVYWRPIAGTMATAMTADGGRFDIVLETMEEVSRPRAAFRFIFERRSGTVSEDLRLLEATPELDAGRIESLIAEFWRCTALLPVVLGRGESLVAFQGYALQLGTAIEITLASEGRARPGGVKRLNGLLSAEIRASLEATVPKDLAASSLAVAQLRLAEIVSERGRECAAHFDIPYPSELEESVLQHLMRELKDLGLMA